MDEPIFKLPPYKVESVYIALSETVDWGLDLLGIPDLWKETTGEGIVVAVLDTGVTYDHPDLRPAIIEIRDFTGTGADDRNGHATHCCGVIGARQNGTGIIGVAPGCKLAVVKVLDGGAGVEQSIINGIDWSAEYGADIISISFGSPAQSQSMHAAIQRASAKSIVVCAAGNEGPGPNTINYPAGYPEAIAVGAIDRRKKVPDFSSRGDHLDIVAPGDNILSCFPPRGYAKLSGTSMACPFVAGILALYMSRFRDKHGRKPTKEEAVNALQSTASDLGTPHPVGGYGLVNPKSMTQLG